MSCKLRASLFQEWNTHRPIAGYLYLAFYDLASYAQSLKLSHRLVSILEAMVVFVKGQNHQPKDEQ